MSVLNDDPAYLTTVFDFFRVRIYLNNFYAPDVKAYFRSTLKLPSKPGKTDKITFETYIKDALRDIYMGSVDDEQWFRRLVSTMKEFASNSWGKDVTVEQIIETWPFDSKCTYISAYTIKGWYGGRHKSIKLKFTPHECTE